jgi:V/A-type H+-transporting ATPase subunit C
MSSGLLAYSGIVTKVRAMQARFLTEDDFRQIVSLPDVPAVAAYLKKKPAYESVLASEDCQNLHRGQLEFDLMDTLLRDFEKIYHFSDDSQRNFLLHYARRFEVRVLKDSLTRLLQGTGAPAEYRLFRHYFDRYSSIHVPDLLEAKTIDGWIAALKGSPYFEPMADVRKRNEQASLFDYETALDLFHFRTIWQDREEIAGSRDNAEILTEFYGTKFDLLNLWYIYRAHKFYKMDKVDIYALTIPVLYRLKKTDIRNLVEAPSEDAFGKILKTTWYGRTMADLDPARLQYLYTRKCRDIVRAGTKKNPYSVASLYCYLYLKEHEIYRLTSALECVRYRMAPADAMKIVTLR